MLNNSKVDRVIALAAVVLVVALSAAIGSRVPLEPVTAATTVTQQSRERAVQEQKLNSAWKAQLATEKAQLQQAQKQQAQQQAASAQAVAPAAPAPPSGGSVEDVIQAAFGPLGATAVQWGLCTAQHESTDNPDAIQVGGGGAEGLFQFIPSTWATTPQGAAGASIFDANASAQAAAWMYSQGQQGQWSTNADFCSMYD